MLQYLEIPSDPGFPHFVRAADGFVARIQKLRWMGLDEEAEALLQDLRDDCLEALVSVPDTD